MRNSLSHLVAFAGGALAMYYLDNRMGARRRALVRDKVVTAGHDTAELLETKGKRAADHLKGVIATGRLDRTSGSQPETDDQLVERIRSRLGRLVARPKAVEVKAHDGQVKLNGHVLQKEIDNVLAEVSGMSGVGKVDNAMTTHQQVSDIDAWTSRQNPAVPQL